MLVTMSYTAKIRHIPYIMALVWVCLVLCTACDAPEGYAYVQGDEAILGTHVYRAVLPDEFHPFQGGQEVDVVIGTQGSMMVVAAVRTNKVPILDEPFTVTVVLTDSNGMELSLLRMRRYPTLESDLNMYFSNLYAVVTASLEDEYSWDGQLATLHVQVHDLDDTVYVDETIDLRLRATDDLF